MVNVIITILTSSSDTIFWISAVAGTTFFLLRLCMSFLGGGFFSDDIDIDSLHDHGGSHSGSSFKFLTMHSLSGFLMMFGWAGLACTKQFNMFAGYAFSIALGCGLVMLGVTALIMRIVMSFEVPGAVFSSKKTVGLIGTVYQRIPAEGLGKIQVVVNNSTRELLAQSHTQTAIESFTVIKVVKAIDHEIVEIIELS